MEQTDKSKQLVALYEGINEGCTLLHNYLDKLDESEYEITAISLSTEGKKYRVLSSIEHGNVIDAYTEFSAKIDQDPSRPLRVPGVIQVNESHKAYLSELIGCINDKKKAFETLCRSMTKGMVARKKAKCIHDALGSTSYVTLQITRKIPFLMQKLNYLGITYHKKPNVVILEKNDVLNRLAIIQERPIKGYSQQEWQSLLKEQRERVELLDETQYCFRATKAPYYRPMVNARSEDGEVFQPSASLPVIVFTEKFMKVSLPRLTDNAKRRSDKQFDPAHPNLQFANIHIRRVN